MEDLMNTKNNKRRRESTAKIEQSLIELLKSKPLTQITVSDICKKACLNRSTFYANYSDIYDLADKIREHLENEINTLYETGHTDKFYSDDFLKLFCHIKDNQPLYNIYFKLGYDNNYKVIFHGDTQALKYFPQSHIEYHVEFFRHGFNAIVKKWLGNGCTESPEEMAEIIRNEYLERT